MRLQATTRACTGLHFGAWWLRYLYATGWWRKLVLEMILGVPEHHVRQHHSHATIGFYCFAVAYSL